MYFQRISFSRRMKQSNTLLLKSKKICILCFHQNRCVKSMKHSRPNCEYRRRLELSLEHFSTNSQHFSFLETEREREKQLNGLRGFVLAGLLILNTGLLSCLHPMSECSCAEGGISTAVCVPFPRNVRDTQSPNDSRGCPLTLGPSSAMELQLFRAFPPPLTVTLRIPNWRPHISNWHAQMISQTRSS